jgi:hypothetical protein
MRGREHLGHQANVSECDRVSEAAFAGCGRNHGLNSCETSGDPRARPFSFGIFFCFCVAFSNGGNALEHPEVLYGLCVAANYAADLRSVKRVQESSGRAME